MKVPVVRKDVAVTTVTITRPFVKMTISVGKKRGLLPMMKSIWFVAACALPALLAAPPARALDFTLSTKTVEEDGYPSEVSYFKYDAQTTVAIRAPLRWQISGTPATLVLISQSFPTSEVRLEKSPFTPGVPFEDKGLERYRQHALAQVPPGSTEVLVTKEAWNPLPIYNWTDYEFLVEYTLFGQRLKRSVMFLNLDASQQLQVTAVGPDTDFGRVHKASLVLLQSWQASSSTAVPTR